MFTQGWDHYVSRWCLTLGYCWTGMSTLSESLMFLLLMTSRYFLTSPSFRSSSPSNFSISARKKAVNVTKELWFVASAIHKWAEELTLKLNDIMLKHWWTLYVKLLPTEIIQDVVDITSWHGIIYAKHELAEESQTGDRLAITSWMINFYSTGGNSIQAEQWRNETEVTWLAWCGYLPAPHPWEKKKILNQLKICPISEAGPLSAELKTSV